MGKRNRDDFSPQVKRTLEKRVSSRCSNPDCRVPTSGPTAEATKSNNIGKAAHIEAASSGGPRYNPEMTFSQRSAIYNGIWLCANCADKIDRDPTRYSVPLLLRWKQDAEQTAEIELGKPLPSSRELALFKTKALGENIGGASVADLVTSIHKIATREIENLDPRFIAEVSHNQNVTKITLNARETVNCRLCIPLDTAEEFANKLDNLQRHGHPLELESEGIKLEGTPIFNNVEGEPKKIRLESHCHYKAVQRIHWTDPGSGKAMVADIMGTITGGTESFTFSGELFNGIYQMSYQVPLHSSGLLTLDMKGKISLSPWVGKAVRQLPYFDKYRSLCCAVASEQAVQSCLEVDGQELTSVGDLKLMSKTEAVSFLGVLNYVSMVRDLLTVLGKDLPLQLVTVSAEDTAAVEEAWLWICHINGRRGDEWGPGHIHLVPLTEENLRDLKDFIQSGTPSPMQVEQELAQPLNLLGHLVSVGPLRIVLSSAILKSEHDVANIKIGESVKIAFTPTNDCAVTVTVENDTKHHFSR